MKKILGILLVTATFLLTSFAANANKKNDTIYFNCKYTIFASENGAFPLTKPINDIFKVVNPNEYFINPKEAYAERVRGLDDYPIFKKTSPDLFEIKYFDNLSNSIVLFQKHYLLEGRASLITLYPRDKTNAKIFYSYHSPLFGATNYYGTCTYIK